MSHHLVESETSDTVLLGLLRDFSEISQRTLKF